MDLEIVAMNPGAWPMRDRSIKNARVVSNDDKTPTIIALLDSIASVMDKLAGSHRAAPLDCQAPSLLRGFVQTRIPYGLNSPVDIRL